MTKNKTVTVKVDESTFRWLNELAKAQRNREVTAAEFLAQAAFCMADYAGRREGSWEADLGRNLLKASYQADIPLRVRFRLSKWEAAFQKSQEVTP